MTSTERPDPLVRLDATAHAVTGLRDIFAAEEPLDDVLARVVLGARQAVLDADAVSVSVLDPDGQSRTAASTGDDVLDVDKAQYAAERGPCLEAARTQRAVRATAGEHRERWPEFADAAERAGMQAYLSVPLLLDLPAERTAARPGRDTVGALNIYSRTASAFDPFDEGLVKLFTTTAEQAVLNARHWDQCRQRVTQLETALGSRAEIDQAKGILMAVHGCTDQEAFAMLVEQSQHQNVKLNQVARDFLASVRTRR